MNIPKNIFVVFQVGKIKFFVFVSFFFLLLFCLLTFLGFAKALIERLMKASSKRIVKAPANLYRNTRRVYIEAPGERVWKHRVNVYGSTGQICMKALDEYIYG